MRNVIRCCVALLMVLFTAMPIQAAEPKKGKEPLVKVGVIDTRRIMRESKAARSALAVFQKDLEAKRGVLAAKQREIKEIEEELKSADPKLTPEARRQKEETLTRETRELKLLKADMEDDLKKRNLELTQQIISEVNGVVGAYVKKEKITLVFERSVVVALDEAVDITGAIIRLYDEGK